MLSKLNHPKIAALALLLLAQTAHGSHQGSSNQRQKQFIVCLNPTATDTCRVQPWSVYSALFMLLFVEILDIEVGFLNLCPVQHLILWCACDEGSLMV